MRVATISEVPISLTWEAVTHHVHAASWAVVVTVAAVRGGFATATAKHKTTV